MELLKTLEEKISHLASLIQELKQKNSELIGINKELQEKNEQLEQAVLQQRESSSAWNKEKDAAKKTVDQILEDIDSLIENESR